MVLAAYLIKSFVNAWRDQLDRQMLSDPGISTDTGT